MMGDEIVHSGAWVVTTKLNEADFADYTKGELGAYSIEGFGLRRPTTKAEMPKVQFVDVTELKT